MLPVVISIIVMITHHLHSAFMIRSKHFCVGTRRRTQTWWQHPGEQRRIIHVHVAARLLKLAFHGGGLLGTRTDVLRCLLCLLCLL